MSCLQLVGNAITADYLIHYDTPSAARSKRTNVVPPSLEL
jgi:hypothetical protein